MSHSLAKRSGPSRDFAEFRALLASDRAELREAAPAFEFRRSVTSTSARHTASAPPSPALHGGSTLHGGSLRRLTMIVAVLVAVLSAAFHVVTASAPAASSAVTPPPNVAAAPLPPTPAAAVTSADFPWMAQRADGSPVTWPCGPIRYRLVTDGAPAGAEQLIANAFARISAVSGYEFREDASVSVVSGDDVGYPGIDIAWVPRQDFLGKDDHDAIGIGGATRTDDQYVHGAVQLLADWSGSGRTDFSHDGAGPILLHELGHALGLNHSQDPAAIMYPTDMGTAQWSPAERVALQRLHQSCSKRRRASPWGIGATGRPAQRRPVFDSQKGPPDVPQSHQRPPARLPVRPSTAAQPGPRPRVATDADTPAARNHRCLAQVRYQRPRGARTLHHTQHRQDAYSAHP